jgi:anti-sigma factor RsiW
MPVNCSDLERLLRDSNPAEWAELEKHAASCAACAEELRAWKRVSLAARELYEEWQSPALWPRIESSLAAAPQRRASRWVWLQAWSLPALSWQTVAAAVLVVVLTGSTAWLLLRQPVSNKATDNRLLKNSAIAEVERTETAYEHAIEKLAAEAKPQLENPATPLLASYREKLLVLDSAIDELRDAAGQNPANAQLRGQLLALYHEKQSTLEEVLEMKR